MRAARELGGFESVEALARAINEPGLSAKTLYSIEREQNDPPDRTIRAIAAACGVPFEWFTVDLNAAIGAGEEPSTLEDLHAMLALPI
jgi:transcriptional regulator with XRE-family HTH domain